MDVFRCETVIKPVSQAVDRDPDVPSAGANWIMYLQEVYYSLKVGCARREDGSKPNMTSRALAGHMYLSRFLQAGVQAVGT